MTLVIDHETVPTLISMEDAIEAVAEAYRALTLGEASESARSNLVLQNGWIRTMSAALPGSGLVGYKEFHRFGGVSRYAYHLFDSATGEPVAILDGRHLTALRTGACGGLAVRELSRSDSTVLGVIGTGAEARAQVEAVLAVRNVEQVRVYSRTASKRDAFCDFVTTLGVTTLGRDIQAEPVPDPAKAVADVDVLVVATNTAGAGPALRAEWIPDQSMHINSIGSTLPNQREIDEGVWAKARQVVIDSPDVLTESGDALAAEKAGTLNRDVIASLGSLLVERGGPAPVGEGVSLYKSVGSAIQDVAMAARIYRNALASGVEFPRLAPFQAVRSVEVPKAEGGRA